MSGGTVFLDASRIAFDQRPVLPEGVRSGRLYASMASWSNARKSLPQELERKFNRTESCVVTIGEHCDWHPVLMARELVRDEPFPVLLADDMVDAQIPCLKQMIEVFNETQCSIIATEIIEGAAISACGVLDVKPLDGRFGRRVFAIQNMVEKPKLEEAPSTCHYWPLHSYPSIFDMLTQIQAGSGGELQLTDGMRMLLKQEGIYAYVLESKRHARPQFSEYR